MERRELSPETAEAEVDEHISSHEQTPKPRKRKSRNKRRFSDEQVRSLETIFELETKLDPRRKAQVARDLGLQPRQVAIWFQNKRARWKSKEIEKKYRALEANYETLKSRVETAKNEKESLFLQLQELRNRLEKSREGRSCSEEFAGDGIDVRRQTEEITVGGFAAELSMIEEELDHQRGAIYSEDDKSGNIAYLGEEEPQILETNEDGDSCLAAAAAAAAAASKWCGFDAGSLFDQSSSSSHWWDSWT
ncbi:hypothetical protein Nepgr_029926 [Nepenthes gracilis]|uniref:Homeobox-leucine zipper protein n=1 Tax=Nepenthes gracilis TaxID=150966 RepID=A0AAD3TDG2_NEPGR|nr:hypothetical protein Nepgr_029926 [Nepenthes gracilis]